jgi:uncharacterized protein
MIRTEHVVRDEAALRGLFPPTHTLAAIKALPALDQHARDFIARAPFLTVGTQGPGGRADVSPRGDPAGFVQVLDDRTLAIPDRPGNNRLDTLSNILADPNIGLLFLVPGFDDTLRVNGTAVLSTDPDLLRGMAVNDRVPTLAIVVTVAEVFLHCAKALRRSRLWDPEARQDRKAMPTLMAMILDQTTGAPDDTEAMARIDAGLEEDYRRSMY